MHRFSLLSLRLSIVLVLLSAGIIIYDQISPRADTTPPGRRLAFPTAEGFGAATIGGRGGAVIEVTNLLDRVPNSRGQLVTAPGSLRAALETSGPRIIVFRVSGTIDLNRSEIELSEPFVTIAGQTAPGDGITIKGGFIMVTAHDVVIRYLRFRPGPGGYASQRPNGASADGLRIGANNGRRAEKVILDHVSISWGTDELLDITGEAHDITVQHSLVAEGLNCIPAPFWHDEQETCHSKGTFLTGNATNMTLHHNLFAHTQDRNPFFNTGNLDYVNNVVYNYGSPFSLVPRALPAHANIVNNAYRAGVDSLVKRASKYEIRLGHICSPNVTICTADQSEVFISGNIGTDQPTGSFRTGQIICPDGNVCPKQRSTRFSYPPVKTQSAETAYKKVLLKAGASLHRDAVDSRIVSDVRNGTGHIINTPDEVGGYPILNSTTAPADTDHDGMPDVWEAKYGLNPNDAQDGPIDSTNDGYTNIEKYLNQLAGDSSYGDTLFVTPPPSNENDISGFSLPPSDNIIAATADDSETSDEDEITQNDSPVSLPTENAPSSPNKSLKTKSPPRSQATSSPILSLQKQPKPSQGASSPTSSLSPESTPPVIKPTAPTKAGPKITPLIWIPWVTLLLGLGFIGLSYRQYQKDIRRSKRRIKNLAP